MRNAVDPKPQRLNNVAPAKPARLSKQESLRLATAFKRAVAVAATLGFGAFIGLVARHNGAAATSQTPSIAPSSQTAAPTQTNPQSNGDANSFFNSQGQSGYGFGVGNNQPPVTGSSSS